MLHVDCCRRVWHRIARLICARIVCCWAVGDAYAHLPGARADPGRRDTAVPAEMRRGASGAGGQSLCGAKGVVTPGTWCHTRRSCGRVLHVAASQLHGQPSLAGAATSLYTGGGWSASSRHSGPYQAIVCRLNSSDPLSYPSQWS